MMKQKITALFLLLILCFPAVQQLFVNGYFPMHDDTQIARVIEMKKALSSGQFPVRWVADLGYGFGYPLFNFYGPLPYYVGALFALFGFDVVTATKIMMAVGMLLPAMTLFLFMGSSAGLGAAFLGSLLYVYAPYHAVQLYVRGAVGELWTLGFFPLLTWGIITIHGKQYIRGIIIGSVGLAGIILSHTLLGYAAVVFVIAGFIIYWVLLILRKSFKSRTSFHFQFPLIASQNALLLLGLGLSAFFWLPAFIEMKYTNVAGQVSATADFRQHFICLSQLWESLWGFGGSIPGCVDGMSFRLGKIQLLFAAIGFFALIVYKRLTSSSVKLFWLGVIITVVSVFFMLSISLRLWQFIYGFNYLQYPWRFLSLASFGLAIIGAYWLLFIRSNFIKGGVLVFAFALLLFFHGKLFRPQYRINRLPTSYESKEELHWNSSHISDEYLPPEFIKPASRAELPQNIINSKEGMEVTNIVDHNTTVSMKITASGDGTIIFNRAYFPGWTYEVNGNSVKPQIIAGLPSVPLMKGDNIITMVFSDTPVRIVANILSFTSVISIIYLLFRKSKLNV